MEITPARTETNEYPAFVTVEDIYGGKLYVRVNGEHVLVSVREEHGPGGGANITLADARCLFSHEVLDVLGIGKEAKDETQTN